MKDLKMKVRPIKNGTVIDHIDAGAVLNVVKILNLDKRHENVVSILMNVSGFEKKKDVVKIESKELSLEEINKISLISPNATINIIRDFNVLEKKQVEVPNSISVFVKCINPNCISNSNEPIQSKFNVYENNKKIQLVCIYCESAINEDIVKYLIL
ncbi:MAG: aspartate carbamoyltransferase regulatory subunit [Methanosarcinales archaeon]|nr:aspartate carbamoyltransferase regulatory subunit [Methanosarcinales archaeon]